MSRHAHEKTMFSQNIEVLRINAGISRRKAAKMVGIPTSTYAAYFDIDRIPKPETLKKICNAFGVTEHEILYGEIEQVEKERLFKKKPKKSCKNRDPEICLNCPYPECIGLQTAPSEKETMFLKAGSKKTVGSGEEPPLSLRNYRSRQI